jgi:hypothetical protein
VDGAVMVLCDGALVVNCVARTTARVSDLESYLSKAESGSSSELKRLRRA